MPPRKDVSWTGNRTCIVGIFSCCGTNASLTAKLMSLAESQPGGTTSTVFFSNTVSDGAFVDDGLIVGMSVYLNGRL